MFFEVYPAWLHTCCPASFGFQVGQKSKHPIRGQLPGWLLCCACGRTSWFRLCLWSVYLSITLIQLLTFCIGCQDRSTDQHTLTSATSPSATHDWQARNTTLVVGNPESATISSKPTTASHAVDDIVKSTKIRTYPPETYPHSFTIISGHSAQDNHIESAYLGLSMFAWLLYGILPCFNAYSCLGPGNLTMLSRAVAELLSYLHNCLRARRCLIFWHGTLPLLLADCLRARRCLIFWQSKLTLPTGCAG